MSERNSEEATVLAKMDKTFPELQFATTSQSRTDVESCRVGHVSEATRHISMLETASVGWSICNSWVGVMSTLAFVIIQGGSPNLLYGLWLVFVMYSFIVYTLAELASVYPSAGGQYHWTAIVAPRSWSRGLSYTCGMINIFSWISISAGVAVIAPQALVALVIHHDPSFSLKAWHVFLIYQAVNLLCLLHNIYTIRRTMWTFNCFFALSLVAFLAATIISLVRAPTYQSTESVWVTFVDGSGWSNRGVIFFIGLLTPGYMYGGLDGAIHLAEEATNAREAVPRALLSTWSLGFLTSFIVSVAAMYSAQDFTTIASTPTGFPILELWSQAMRSKVAADAFVAFFFVGALMALAGCQQTASRLTWAFARDTGLILSSKLSTMHARHEAPVWALWANGFVVFIIGCVYLGSSTAFNAFIGVGSILQLVTFAFPAALLLARGRPARLLPRSRTFGLPHAFGWIANLFTVGFAVICLIFWDLPAVLPVTGSNMNYSSAVIGVIGIFIAVNWFFWARKHYKGPELGVFGET
ncbi:amino acid transporter, partial [Aureobasidium melanogenum]